MKVLVEKVKEEVLDDGVGKPLASPKIQSRVEVSVAQGCVHVRYLPQLADLPLKIQRNALI